MKLLLIAGWGFSKEIWAPVEENLSGRWSIEKVDFLDNNFVKNDDLPFARQTKGMIDRVEPDVVAGWSLGAIVLLETLVEFDPPEFLPVLLSGTARFVRREEEGPPGVEPARLRAMRRGIQRDPAPVIEQFYQLVADPAGEIPEEGRINKVNRPEQLLKGLGYLGDVDLTNRLEEVRREVKLIHGVEDAVIPVSAGRLLANNLEDSELIEVAGGHLAPVKNWQILEEILKTRGGK
ncbi:MAG: alpha/beta fold hydrolase [bacterium]